MPCTDLPFPHLPCKCEGHLLQDSSSSGSHRLSMLQLHRSLSQRLRQNIADLQLESQTKPQVNRRKTEKVELWSLGHFIYRKPALQNKHLSSGMCMTLVCCLPETNSEDRTDRSKMLQLGMNLQMTLPSHLRGGNRRLCMSMCVSVAGSTYLFS